MKRHPTEKHLVPEGTQAGLIGPIIIGCDEDPGWEVNELHLWDMTLDWWVAGQVLNNNAFNADVDQIKFAMVGMPAPLFFAWAEYVGGKAKETVKGNGVWHWQPNQYMRFYAHAEGCADAEDYVMDVYLVFQDGSQSKHGLRVPVSHAVKLFVEEGMGKVLTSSPPPVPAQPVNAFGLPMQKSASSF